MNKKAKIKMLDWLVSFYSLNECIKDNLSSKELLK